jgi:ectoine hydroxylase-related dioxygenase (phytanoyl-CoA dioxygenase family)
VNAQVIFNNKKSGGDKKRLQTPISTQNGPTTTRRFCQSVESFIKTNYPLHYPNNTVILTSIEGCKAQLPHCDYEPTAQFANASDQYIPLGCLIALEPGTKLIVWPKSIRLSCMNEYLRSEHIEHIGGPIKSIEITLNPGDVLIFRGDLVHAGAAYNAKKNRVHVYLDSSVVARSDNTTWFPDESWIE